MTLTLSESIRRARLNESPSQKEGKLLKTSELSGASLFASMKVPPKRKGNETPGACWVWTGAASMKVPPKRKGNISRGYGAQRGNLSLNESPSQKEGKSLTQCRRVDELCAASMKVPPKRKGNPQSSAYRSLTDCKPQ